MFSPNVPLGTARLINGEREQFLLLRKVEAIFFVLEKTVKCQILGNQFVWISDVYEFKRIC